MSPDLKSRYAAHIYSNVAGATGENDVTVRPYDPYKFHHHLVHRKEAHYIGEHVPEEFTFYEQVASDLIHAKEIVLIGLGTGKSSALDFFTEYLNTHHPAIAKRVIATEVLDLSALTEKELESIARKHMAA
jgi:hypothetical protein